MQQFLDFFDNVTIAIIGVFVLALAAMALQVADAKEIVTLAITSAGSMAMGKKLGANQPMEKE